MPSQLFMRPRFSLETGPKDATDSAEEIKYSNEDLKKSLHYDPKTARHILNTPELASRLDRETLISSLCAVFNAQEIVNILLKQPKLTAKFDTNDGVSCSEGDIRFAQMVIEQGSIEKFSGGFKQYLEACKLEISLYEAARMRV